MEKCLIVFFSRRGEHFVDGKTVFKEVGNTERVAQMLHELTRADLFRLKMEIPYSEDYFWALDAACQDLHRRARPKLTALPELDAYDVIYLGFPNYWDTMPMPVYTFLEAADLAGKTIKPFCTHDGGGLGHSEADLRGACPTARIVSGLAIHSADVLIAQEAISDWVRQSE